MKLTSKSASFLTLLALILPVLASAEESFDLSKGHFGGEIEMMPGTQMGGQMTTSISYQTNSWESYLGAAFFSTRGSGDSNSTNGKNAQLLAEVRAGKRFQMGEWNFLTAGVDYAPQFGKANGLSSFPGTYTVGPYVGFARQFPKSNVILTAFVIPYEYQSTSTNLTTSHYYGTAVFMDGGIGIDYLF